MRSRRVAVVERSAILVEGVRSLLLQSADYEVVAVCDDMRDFSQRQPVARADMVIVSTQIEEGAALRSSYAELQDVTLVALAVSVRDEGFMRQFDGVINLYDSPQQILHRLHKAVEHGETNPYQDSHDLSERERDVLIEVAKGLSNKEIADRLNISVHTVISHRKNISHKTGIKSVAGLTVYAMLHNLLE